MREPTPLEMISAALDLLTSSLDVLWPELDTAARLVVYVELDHLRDEAPDRWQIL